MKDFYSLPGACIIVILIGLDLNSKSCPLGSCSEPIGFWWGPFYGPLFRIWNIMGI